MKRISLSSRFENWNAIIVEPTKEGEILMHQLVQKIVIFNPISKYYLKSIWKQGGVVFPVGLLTFGHEQAPNYEGYSLDRIKMTE